MKKHSLFSKYRIWPRTIIQIEKLKNINSVKNYCTKLNKMKNFSAVEEYLINSTKPLCLNKFLRMLSKYHSKNKLNHSDHIDFFTNNISLFLNKTNINEFKYWLGRFKINSKTSLLYSNAISEFYIKSKRSPQKDILSYLTITSKLTRFIQSGTFEAKDNAGIIFRQLRKLASLSLTAVDKEKDNNQINLALQDTIDFYLQTYQVTNSKKMHKRMLLLGKSMVRRGQYKAAKKIYNVILDTKSKLYEETIFELLWTYINRHDYKGAIDNVYSKYLVNSSTLATNKRIQFWVGYTMLQNSEDKKAQNIFSRLIKSNPLSYYAIISSKILNELNGERSEYLDHTKKDDKNFKIAPSEISKKSRNILKRIALWGRVDNKKFIRLESKALATRPEDQELLTLASANLLSKSNNYLEGFKSIYRGLKKNSVSFNNEVLEVLFPSPFYKSIKKKTRGFDPIIALSLIRQESGFNVRAQSRVGARGLMQLMPRTARQFRKRVRKSQLFNTNLNITIGTKFFSNLMKRYNGNLVYSLSAYNAGPSRVDRWQGDYLNQDSILHNVENIPFPETEKYVKLIFRNIFFYKMLKEKKSKKRKTIMDSLAFNELYDVHLGFKK